MMKFLPILLFAALSFQSLFAAAPSITYTLSMEKPWTHYYTVRIAFEGLPAREKTLDVALPAWRTGRYVIFDFASGVDELTARDGAGKELKAVKTDKSTWQISSGGASAVTVVYTLFANEFSLRTRGLNDEHGFVDPAAVLMYAPAYRHVPLTLNVEPYGTWHVTTGLDSVAGKRFTFRSPDYDYLADCPLEIGNQRDTTFLVEGKPHVISVFGQTNQRLDSLAALARQIIELNVRFWGDMPYERYVFLMHAMQHAGGGTEHINSCVLDFEESISRRPGNARELIGLFSHEFLHTWNVKRLRPKSMDPYDWAKENYSREIWIAEGGTSYLHGWLLGRNGLSSPRGALDGLGWQIENERRQPGNRVQSIAGCSFDAWIKYFAPLPQAQNRTVDLYGRGAQICMLLDLEMRQRSDNRTSFPDLMKTMYHRFPLDKGGYTLDDFQRTAEELAGQSLDDFFQKFVYGTAPLEWERILGYAGLQVIPADTSARPFLGVMASDESGRAIVRQVVAGSSAYEAGVNEGDELLALNGYRVHGTDLVQRIAEMSVGEQVTLTIFRGNRLRQFTFALGRQGVPPYVVRQVAAPTKLQRAIFESWLTISWDAGH